jgi:hypothetical protein
LERVRALTLADIVWLVGTGAAINGVLAAMFWLISRAVDVPPVFPLIVGGGVTLCLLAWRLEKREDEIKAARDVERQEREERDALVAQIEDTQSAIVHALDWLPIRSEREARDVMRRYGEPMFRDFVDEMVAAEWVVGASSLRARVREHERDVRIPATARAKISMPSSTVKRTEWGEDDRTAIIYDQLARAELGLLEVLDVIRQPAARTSTASPPRA